jgi:hypothetical protein
MITRRLWRNLQTPPSGHPLFQRLFYERNRATWERIRGFLWSVTLLLAIGLLIIMPVVFFFIMVTGPLVYALLNTIFFNALWLMDIAGTLAREISQKTYELYCLMPVGALGIDWIISADRIHYNNGLQRSINEVLGVVQLLSLVTMFFMIGFLISNPVQEQTQLLTVLSVLGAIIFWLYIDHIQTTLCVVCLGILAGRQTRTIGDARLWSLILFLTLQIGWYLLVLLTFLALIVIMIRIPTLATWLSLGLTPWLAVGVSIGGRELLLRFLWQRVLLITNSQSNDLNLLRPYYYTTQRLLS